MIIFQTFWRIMRRYWFIVFAYIGMTISLSLINYSNTNNQTTYTDTKPQITVINQSPNLPLTQNFLNYLDKNANLINLSESEITDALFYQRIDLALFLPSNLETQILSGQKITLNYRASGNYSAELAKNLVARFFELQNSELSVLHSSTSTTSNPQTLSDSQLQTLITNLNQKLETNITVNITAKHTSTLNKITSFYNFASYTLMVIILFVTCLINASFNKPELKKRTLVSSLPLKRYNSSLLLSNCLFSLVVFLIFLGSGFLIAGEAMLTPFSLLYLSIFALFTFCCITLAELIANLTTSKNAISGIVNLVSLGSAFLSGAFIPANFLPTFVLNFAHILPSYWLINANNNIQYLEDFSLNSIISLLPNCFMLILFSILFIVFNHFITKKKRKTS